jgi:Rrf2 family protein
MLSNTCKYGIRAVIYLAVNGDGPKKIGIKKISEDLKLPAPFLGKILQQLAKQKILDSTKGPNGGFSMARNPDEVSLYDIVAIIDGTDIFEECLIGMQVCKRNKDFIDSDCPFFKKSHKVRSDLKSLFENQSIGAYAKGIRTLDADIAL